MADCPTSYNSHVRWTDPRGPVAPLRVLEDPHWRVRSDEVVGRWRSTRPPAQAGSPRMELSDTERAEFATAFAIEFQRTRAERRSGAEPASP